MYYMLNTKTDHRINLGPSLTHANGKSLSPFIIETFLAAPVYNSSRPPQKRRSVQPERALQATTHWNRDIQVPKMKPLYQNIHYGKNAPQFGGFI